MFINNLLFLEHTEFIISYYIDFHSKNVIRIKANKARDVYVLGID